MESSWIHHRNKWFFCSIDTNLCLSQASQRVRESESERVRYSATERQKDGEGGEQEIGVGEGGGIKENAISIIHGL